MSNPGGGRNFPHPSLPWLGYIPPSCRVSNSFLRSERPRPPPNGIAVKEWADLCLNPGRTFESWFRLKCTFMCLGKSFRGLLYSYRSLLNEILCEVSWCPEVKRGLTDGPGLSHGFLVTICKQTRKVKQKNPPNDNTAVAVTTSAYFLFVCGGVTHSLGLGFFPLRI